MKPFAFPPFTPPPDLLEVGLILMLQSKKAGKTTLGDVICSILVHFGYVIAAIRNDQHDRLDRYVPSTRIELATTHDMIEGNVSLDLDRHEVVIDLIEEMMPRPRNAIVYDSSAAAGDRLPTVLLRDLYAQRFDEYGRSCLILVPLRTADDVAAGALKAMEAAALAMPGQLVVPVVIAQDAAIAVLPRDHDFYKCIAMAKHGVIKMPFYQPAIAGLIDRLTIPLSELTELTSLAVRRSVSEDLGCTTGQAGLVVTAIAEMVGVMTVEIAKLGICQSAD